MHLQERSDDFWELFIEVLFNNIYQDSDVSEDYLKLGGWLNDIEACDATIDEMVCDIAINITTLYQDNENSEQFENNKKWISEVICVAYEEADKKFPS